ncbi:hypothetical protein Tco_0763206 [Tanacetum coccineum]
MSDTILWSISNVDNQDVYDIDVLHDQVRISIEKDGKGKYVEIHESSMDRNVSLRCYSLRRISPRTTA